MKTLFIAVFLSVTCPALLYAESAPMVSVPMEVIQNSSVSPWEATLSSEVTVMPKSYELSNFVGLTYKWNSFNKVGLRQYFTYTHDDENSTNVNTLDDVVATYTRYGVPGVLGSKEPYVSLRYYLPTSQASQELNSKGTLRADLQFNWTINPKWEVSYYFAPRQYFIPDTESSYAKT